MDRRTCRKCSRVRPLEDFRANKRAVDGTGKDTLCKACHAASQRKARAPEPPPRTGLVLVMSPRPAPPPEDPEPEPPARALGHYEAAVEKFLASLEPPPGDQDAIVVTSLRGYALLADRATVLGSLDPTRELNTCILGMTKLQRELVATRAAKRAVGGPQADAGPDKLDQFLEAL